MSRPHIINQTLEDLGQGTECLEFYIDELEEKNKKLRAEVERLENLKYMGVNTEYVEKIKQLEDELNTEKFRTCERCVEKTASRCAEISLEVANTQRGKRGYAEGWRDCGDQIAVQIGKEFPDEE